MSATLAGGMDERYGGLPTSTFFMQGGGTTGGYICSCGAWVGLGSFHACSPQTVTLTPNTSTTFIPECRHCWKQAEVFEVEGTKLLIQRCSNYLCNKVEVLATLSSRARRTRHSKQDRSDKRQ